MALLSFALLAPNFAAADNKPIEQFWDQGPAVKNVGGYTGILVEDAGRITGRQSRMIGMYYEQKMALGFKKRHLPVKHTQTQIVQMPITFGMTQY